MRTSRKPTEMNQALKCADCARSDSRVTDLRPTSQVAIPARGARWVPGRAAALEAAASAAGRSCAAGLSESHRCTR